MSKHVEAGKKIGELLDTKQAAYGNSFGKAGDIMRILYPHGVSLSKMDDALTVVRVLDKLFRIATDRDALGESPWKDIAGYALLSVVRMEGTKQTPQKEEGVQAAPPLVAPPYEKVKTWRPATCFEVGKRYRNKEYPMLGDFVVAEIRPAIDNYLRCIAMTESVGWGSRGGPIEHFEVLE